MAHPDALGTIDKGSISIGRRAILAAAGGILLPRTAWARRRYVGPISATFVQPWEAHLSFDAAKWSELLEEFALHGMHTIYVQWMCHRKFGSLAPEPLLAACERLEFKVHFGLCATGEAARLYERGDATTQELDSRYAASLQLAAHLAPLVTRSRSFAGWYLPEELDDVMAADGDRLQAWTGHLAKTSAALAELTPSARVSISSYVSGRLSPQAFAEVWRQIWSSARSIALLMQDGFGVAFLRENEILGYLYALEQARRNTGANLGLIVELFEQTAGAPIDQRPFQARPAKFERLVRQLQVGNAISGLPLTAFTAGDYMIASRGKEAADLSRSYRAGFVRSG